MAALTSCAAVLAMLCSEASCRLPLWQSCCSWSVGTRPTSVCTAALPALITCHHRPCYALQAATSTSSTRSCGCSSQRSSVPSHAAAATAASRRSWSAGAIPHPQGSGLSPSGRCWRAQHSSTSSRHSRCVLIMVCAGACHTSSLRDWVTRGLVVLHGFIA